MNDRVLAPKIDHFRLIGVSGLTHVGLLIVAFIVGKAPEAEKSDSTILEYYTDSGNQVKQMITAILALAAVCDFLVFATGLRSMLLDSGAPPPLPDLAFVGGLVSATLALAGFAVGTAVPATFAFSDTFELNPDTARIVLTIGNIWLLSFAGASASLLVGAVSLASRRIGLLPGWLEWAGLVLAPLMVLALPAFGVSALALLVWVIALSIVLLLRVRRAR